MALMTNEAQAERAGLTCSGLTDDMGLLRIRWDKILAEAREMAQPVPRHLKSVTFPDFRRK